jgi:hypothetical protein
MVPPSTHPVWARLIRGELEHSFTATAPGMLFFTLRRQNQKDPRGLDRQVDEARRFFQKYESVFADDLAKLFR